jgi:hypothetical protein
LDAFPTSPWKYEVAVVLIDMLAITALGQFIWEDRFRSKRRSFRIGWLAFSLLLMAAFR